MSMAAQFPLKSTSTSKENVRVNELNKEAEICVIHQDDTIEKHENLSDVIHNQKSIIPSESFGHQSKETSETDRSLLEHGKSLQEEFISSQDSFDSRNSQSIGGIRSCSGSNSEAEDRSTIGKPTQNNISSIDFLEMRKINNFEEHFCHNNSGCKNGQSEVGPLKSRSERMEHLNYLPSFIYPTSPDHQFMKVPVNPTIKNELSKKQKFEVPEAGCYETSSEESTTSSPSNSSTLTKAKENNLNIISRQLQGDLDVSSVEHNGLWGSQEMPPKDLYGFLGKDATEKQRISQHESQNECVSYGDFKLENASTMEPRKLKRTNVDKEKMNSIDWDNLRQQVEINGPKKETEDTMDSLDYEAVRCADVKEISDAIKERGMNNRLAERMQVFTSTFVDISFK